MKLCIVLCNCLELCYVLTHVKRKTLPDNIVLLTFAPFSIRILAQAAWPCMHAAWMGETRSKVLRFTQELCEQHINTAD